MRGRQKTIIITLAVLAVLITAAGLFARQQSLKNHPTATRGATGSGGEKTATGIDQPPSSAPSDPASSTPTPAPGHKTTIKPVISTAPYVAAGQVHLRAFADGASGAQCTATFTAAGTASVSAQATTNDQGVCQGFDLPLAQFTKGSWTARIAISSATVEGTSDAATFTVN